MITKPLRRVGLLGGTFNPVHNGHLAIARAAQREFQLDEVRFVPCAVPPHKMGEALAPSADRLAMLRLALAGAPSFSISDLEVARGGVSYSIETVRELQARQPAAVFFFLIGADSLFQLHTWREIGGLIQAVEFIVLARPGFDLAGVTPERLRLAAEPTRRLLKNVCRGTAADVSATEVRRRVAAGEDFNPLVPAAVADYIAAHGLYCAKRKDHA